MKTCPKCSRPYDDESLNFCLDDGEWLQPDDGENVTRFLPGDDLPSEASTKQKIAGTDETAILPTDRIKDPEAMDGGFRYRKALIGTASALVLILVIGFGSYYLFREPTGARDPLPEIETIRLTGDGKVREAAISPDGKLLAYLEVKDEKVALRLKQIETNSTVEILREGEFTSINNVVFSPDANFVYFGGVEPDRKMSIYRVPTLGGSPTSLDLPSMSFSLSPDGKEIAYYDDNAETTETRISVADSDGKNSRPIISRSGTKWVDAGTAWSPDGEHLLFVEGDDGRAPDPLMSLAIHAFEDGSSRKLGTDYWERIDNNSLVWDPSGQFVYLNGEHFAVDPLQVWRVSVPGGESVKLTANRSDYSGLSLTSDGTTMVTIEEVLRTGVWVSPDKDPMKAVEVVPGRVDTWGLSWTPDDRIVYVSDQSGAPEVWVMNADGSDQRQLTNDRIAKAEPVVSPDGKTVAYHSPHDGFQIYKVDIGGGTPVKIETGEVGPENPAFSPDGKYIAFSAWTGGKQRLYRIPAAGGRSERLTEYPSSEPSYAPDGSLIACFYLTQDDHFVSLGIIPAEGGAPTRKFSVPTSTMSTRGLVWTPDGENVTYIVRAGEKLDLWVQPVAGGDPVRISDFERPWIQRRAYSRDGKRIAITRGEAFGDALMLKGLR